MQEEYEQNKRDNLKRQEEGNAYWNEHLASNSEANVKADRDETPVDLTGAGKDKGKQREEEKEKRN